MFDASCLAECLNIRWAELVSKKRQMNENIELVYLSLVLQSLRYNSANYYSSFGVIVNSVIFVRLEKKLSVRRAARAFSVFNAAVRRISVPTWLIYQQEMPQKARPSL